MSLDRLLRLFRKGRLKLRTGEVVEIRPLTVRQSCVVEKLFEPVAVSIAEHGLENFVYVQSKHASELVGIVATAISKDVGFVDAMDREDFNALWKRLLGVEGPFFRALVAVAARARQTGPESSKL